MPKGFMQRVAIFFLVTVIFLATLGLETCGAAAGKQLNILTINLMLINPVQPFDWPTRADTLVSFVHQQEVLGQPVDFILCQEGHGGVLSQILGGGGDTILDLQQRLMAAGLTYYTASIVCFQNTETGGYPFESNFLVGILSKYPILQVEQGELTCDATVPPEPAIRKAIACITLVPGIGRVNLFSAHLADACGGSVGQGEQLMAFANLVGQNYPATLSIFGGDFNALSDSGLYNYLTNDMKLIDTFAAANDLSTNPGYTFAVPGNPFGANAGPKRIDYIFAITSNLQPLGVIASRVALNATEGLGNFMSDHCGVLSQIYVSLPPGGKSIPGIFLLLP
jgi:endonuclease/exonuclease/phosphatase family metal-dependent hydrolase